MAGMEGQRPMTPRHAGPLRQTILEGDETTGEMTMTPEQREIVTKLLHLLDAANAVLRSQQETPWSEQFTPVSKIALGGLEYFVHAIDESDLAELLDEAAR